MIVGLISDTHDRIRSIKRAMSLFREEGVELVLHAGDIISPFTAKYFDIEMMAVFGNNDGDRLNLEKNFSNCRFLGEFGEVELSNGKKVFLIHKLEDWLLEVLVSSGRYLAIVHGHTHVPEIKELGGTKVVNPGEACGYVSGKETMALLDTEREEVWIKTLRS